jgi:type I restriction enzyme S subunit
MKSRGWKKTKLGTHCEIVSGFPFKSDRFSDDPDDVALVKGENVGQGRILWEISKRWSRADLISLDRFRLIPGDVVLAMDRPWVPAGLKFARIPESAPEAILVQRVARLRATNGLIQDFLACLIGSSSFVAYIQNIARGVGVPHISGKEIAAFEFEMPLEEVQRRIATILTAYDDLIENNRRRIALLEESARLLYREWFVRLRFPGHEHTRVVNGVPEGWRKLTLGDICADTREMVSPESLEPETPYIGLEHMPRRAISLADWGAAEQVTSSKLRFNTGDILFGKIRPYFHKVGIAFTDGVVSSDAFVIRPVTENLKSFVLMTVSSDGFVADTAQAMKEGSKMPRADWKQMIQYSVLLPPSGLLGDFTETVTAITDQLKNLCFQNQKLRTARDLLLPKLMRGEIDV